MSTGIDHALRKRDTSLKACSETFISSHLAIDSLFQRVLQRRCVPRNGIFVSDAVSNVTFNSDGLVGLPSSSPVAIVASTTPSVSFNDAKTITVVPIMTVNVNAVYFHVRFSPTPFANYLRTGIFHRGYPHGRGLSHNPTGSSTFDLLFFKSCVQLPLNPYWINGWGVLLAVLTCMLIIHPIRLARCRR
ncbi:hypothetical protein B0H13DRAFT_1871179 [Mycena leptocephala]|nr:hypothetical protein B0H13DRAFT_1871179 [Mycena leptocephala]